MTTEAPKTGKTILCVDDNHDACEIVQYLLRPSGTLVEVAQSVAEGCQKAQSNRYDLILLDYRLADGTGIDLLECVRGYDRQTPILFYSAEAHEEIIQQALAAGAQEYLVKPKDTGRLVERVLFHTDSQHLSC